MATCAGLHNRARAVDLCAIFGIVDLGEDWSFFTVSCRRRQAVHVTGHARSASSDHAEIGVIGAGQDEQQQIVPVHHEQAAGEQPSRQSARER